MNITHFDYDFSSESECDDCNHVHLENIQDRPFIYMTYFELDSDEEDILKLDNVQNNEKKILKDVITFKMLDLVKLTLRQWQLGNKTIPEIIVKKISKKSPKGFKYNFSSDYFNNVLIGKHKKVIFCSVIESTENRKRCILNLKKNNIRNTILSKEDYYKSLKKYKFVVSPEGIKIDCYTHYESLMCGCIPIIQRSKKIINTYHCCPILYTIDYSEISIDYLNKVYALMIDRFFDFSPLFLSKYK